MSIFADFYERASADIERQEPAFKPFYIANRDAQARGMQQEIRATVAIDRVRAYALAKFGAELTIGTARQLLGDLVRICGLTVDAAEALRLETAMDMLPKPAPSKPERERADRANGKKAADKEQQQGQGADAGKKADPQNASNRFGKGEADKLLAGALLAWHKYQLGGSCDNYAPVKCNAFADNLGISRSTASGFFTKHFGSHAEYRVGCIRAADGDMRFVAKLKILAGDTSDGPATYGKAPPERRRDGRPQGRADNRNREDD